MAFDKGGKRSKTYIHIHFSNHFGVRFSISSLMFQWKIISYFIIRYIRSFTRSRFPMHSNNNFISTELYSLVFLQGKKSVSHSNKHHPPIIFLRNQKIEKENEFSVARFSFLTIGFVDECQFIIDGSIDGCQSKSNSQLVNSVDFVKLLWDNQLFVKYFCAQASLSSNPHRVSGFFFLNMIHILRC